MPRSKHTRKGVVRKHAKRSRGLTRTTCSGRQ